MKRIFFILLLTFCFSDKVLCLDTLDNEVYTVALDSLMKNYCSLNEENFAEFYLLQDNEETMIATTWFQNKISTILNKESKKLAKNFIINKKSNIYIEEISFQSRNKIILLTDSIISIYTINKNTKEINWHQFQKNEKYLPMISISKISYNNQQNIAAFVCSISKGSGKLDLVVCKKMSGIWKINKIHKLANFKSSY